MAELGETGTIFDIQSMSFHDGPGIRTLVFLKGCPLKCLWCSNPEGQKSIPEIRYIKSRCSGCMDCVKVCNDNAISFNRDGDNKADIMFKRYKCDKCREYKCADACLTDAIKVTGKIMTVGQVMERIKKDVPFYKRKGGVTLSGGDPTFQPEFAARILEACHEEYIETAVESAMFVKWEMIRNWALFADLFICDIKHIDPDIHNKLTGLSNEIILSNIINVSRLKPVIVRIPVIPGLNDDERNIIGTAEFCYANNIREINILPYHKLGIPKYGQLGKDYKIPLVKVVSEERMNYIKSLIEKAGITCIFN